VTGWNPFRKLTSDEQRAVEIMLPLEICAVCGKNFTKGERALPMAPCDRFYAADGFTRMYPRHDGSTSVNTTFRHLGCTP